MRLHLGMLQAIQAGDIEEADRCEQKLQVGARIAEAAPLEAAACATALVGNFQAAGMLAGMLLQAACLCCRAHISCMQADFSLLCPLCPLCRPPSCSMRRRSGGSTALTTSEAARTAAAAGGRMAHRTASSIRCTSHSSVFAVLLHATLGRL